MNFMGTLQKSRFWEVKGISTRRSGDDGLSDTTICAAITKECRLALAYQFQPLLGDNLAAMASSGS